MVRNKRLKLLSFIIGCFLSALVGLSFWGAFDLVWTDAHPYLAVVAVNMIGYIGHGITTYVVRKYIVK